VSQPAYKVVLPVFEGPLDLLLHLIEREELDITQVSLAQVAQQFLDYVAQLSESNPDRLADFLVVAAKLLLIKSRALLPRPQATVEPEEEAGQDLVQQLIEYRKFKGAANWLRELDAQGLQSYIRLSGTADLSRPADLTGVTLDILLAAVREALQVPPPEPLLNGTIPPLIVTVAQQIERLRGELAASGLLSFTAFLRQAESRLEIVVTFLAVLEMVKLRQVAIRQDVQFGDILISALPPREA
jgi:segregation and condensation protein A